MGEPDVMAALAWGALALALGCSEAPPPHAVLSAIPRAPVVDGGVPSKAQTEPPLAPKPDAEADADKHEPREQRLIARMLERMSRVRGLAANKPVPGVVLGREALIARVKAHVDREVPHEAIVEEGIVQQLLGFIPARFDYEAETYALLSAQLAGFYEPADGTMYMAADLDDENATATLAHELVHALQDQHWDLGKRSKYAPGQDDRSTAFSALAEGDATSAMADLLVGSAKPGATALDMPDELFTEQIIGGMSGGPVANTPHVMRMSLVAPYIDGTLFIHALRRKGGWPAVNRAWESPPVSTEQVLHVDKWEAHEPPIVVDDPTLAALGPGWTVAEDDTYGELGVRLAFGEWVGAARASRLAAAWGGDRGVLVKNNSAYAFAWHIRYDEAKSKPADAYASRAYAEVAQAIEKLGVRPTDGSPLAAARRDPRQDGPKGFACVERAELGPLAVARRGRDVVIVAGPANVSSRGWTSAARCAKARAWVEEIVGR
jgi:hypothetical protein